MNENYFSVIIPVYNVKAYLDQCVESILQQSYENFELILVDDGSTDGSGALCDEYSKRDFRIKVVHKANGGLSSARNKGLSAAIGDYIVFLDSDDYWDNDRGLELINTEIERTQADVVLIKHKKLFMSTGQYRYDKKSTPVKFDYMPYEEQLRYCVANQLFDACAWNKVFKRSLMGKKDLFFTEKIISEDIDWAARLSLISSRIAIIEEPIHVYRKGRAGAITSSLKLVNLIDTKDSIERCISYVETMNLSAAFEEAYFSYVAYRYTIWMAEYDVIVSNEKNKLLQSMKNHRWLLSYQLNAKVKLANIFVRIIGFENTMHLLGTYLKSRKI